MAMDYLCVSHRETDGPGTTVTSRTASSAVTDNLKNRRKESMSVLRWKKAYEMQLPEIRRRLSTKKTSFSGLSGNGAITLVQL